MRPIWLIESGVYGDELPPLLAEIHRQGMTAAIIPHSALKKGSTPMVDGRSVSPDDRVIGYGTFPFARQIQIHHPWKPGAWCSEVNLNCATYYAHFGPYLLNRHYAMMPGVEAIRQADWLFSTIGNGEQIFARPTSCHKLFVGRLIPRDDFAAALAPTRYDPTTLVVIAAPKSIAREWRLIVTGNRVISGSQYAVAGQRAITPELPTEVVRFAESMLANVRWRPDPIFMLDICEAENELHLVELNSFSGSWLYAADLPAVVAAAGELARQ